MPRDSLEYNMKIIEDERVASLRETGCRSGYIKFDSKLAEKILREQGYGDFIDELDRLLKDRK